MESIKLLLHPNIKRQVLSFKQNRTSMIQNFYHTTSAHFIIWVHLEWLSLDRNYNLLFDRNSTIIIVTYYII